jgi:hypothetical protein
MIPRAYIARACWLGAFYLGLGVIWKYKVSTMVESLYHLLSISEER